jgi:hypothetical protein
MILAPRVGREMRITRSAMQNIRIVMRRTTLVPTILRTKRALRITRTIMVDYGENCQELVSLWCTLGKHGHY